MDNFYVVGKRYLVWNKDYSLLEKGTLVREVGNGKWCTKLDCGDIIERSESEIFSIPKQDTELLSSNRFSNPTAKDSLDLIDEPNNTAVSALRKLIPNGFKYEGVVVTPDSIVNAEYLGSYGELKGRSKTFCTSRLLDRMMVCFEFNDVEEDICVPAHVSNVDSISITKGNYNERVKNVYDNHDIGCPVVWAGGLFYSILKINDDVYLCGSKSTPECKYLQISRIGDKITFKMPKRIGQ